MSLKREQKKVLLYKVVLYGVLLLSVAALIAEILPEVSAKMFVIPALLLIMAICIIDLFKLKSETRGLEEDN
jgi:hypothetical protein